MAYESEKRTVAAQLQPDSLIDQIVADKAAQARVNKVGWVLDMAREARELDLRTALHAHQLCSIVDEDKTSLTVEEITRLREGLERISDATVATSRMQPSIEFRESLPRHDEWEPPRAYRNHQLRGVDSLAAYAKRYGDKMQSVIAVSRTAAVLVIEEMISRGQRERLTMPFIQSEDWGQWSKLLNSPAVTHKDLHKFLLHQEHNLEDPGILLATSKVKFQASVDHLSDLTSDGDAYGIMFKTAKGEELLKFPRSWTIRLPVLEEDVLGEYRATAKVRLEVNMPTEAGKPVTFSLFCSEWHQLWDKRIQEEVNAIREELPDWLVIYGETAYRDRELGE